MNKNMIDLFAGVGGLSLGFEMCGFEVVLANEYDKSIAEAYIKNRKDPNMIVDDITQLPIKDTFGKITTEEEQLNELKRILEEIRRGIKITDLENKINFIKSKLDPEQLYNFVFTSTEL